MNIKDIFNNATVTRMGNHLFVTKSDGVIEITEHDCACPPGTNGGLRLNSFTVWTRINNQEWFKLNVRSMVKTLICAVTCKSTKDFLIQVKLL